MLNRINELLGIGVDFALETTLATKSYVKFVKKAQQKGYNVTLLYFWLDSAQTACTRVAKRVSEGGHNIPVYVIERRYYRGIENLITLDIPICDNWMVVNNMSFPSKIVARKSRHLEERVINDDI